MNLHLLSLGRATVLFAFVVVSALPLPAQINNPPVGVSVKIWAQGTAEFGEGDTGSLILHGDFLGASPDSGVDQAISPDNTTDVSGTTLTAVIRNNQEPLNSFHEGFVRVEPGKPCTVYVDAPNVYGGEINVVPPPGYRVVMDNEVRSREGVDGSSVFVIELQAFETNLGIAGMASSIANREIEWRVSLGNLQNGGSAGELAMIDTGINSSWSTIFTPGALFYEPTASEISVYRPDNTIRQIIANQVVIDVVQLPNPNPTYYEIRCYHPSQMQGTTDPRTFTGSAFATYRVEQGSTATSVKITKEIRNVTDSTSSFSVARREIMTLVKTGTWPAITWTKTDSTLENQAALAETYVVSSAPASARTETISVRVPGTSTVATSVTRNFTVPTVGGNPVIGEVLSTQTVGTNTGLTASFEFYKDTSQLGSLNHLKSATLPGGDWVAYEYYDANLNSAYSGGRIKYRYKPYLNSPSTVPTSLSASQGEVTYHEYVNDVYGAPTRPSLVQTTVNGTLTAKTTISYNDYYAWVNSHGIAQATRTAYNDSTHNLVTTVRHYREYDGDSLVRGQTHSITYPDGMRQSFAYIRGDWDGSSFTSGSSSSFPIGFGSASRISAITGSSNSSAGPALTMVESYQLDTVYVIEGKSTKDVTIRDSRALVVRTESHIWKNNAWQLVTYTNYSYDFAGRLASRTASNGGTYTATYDGGLKTSETDEAGVTTNYTYDVMGRVSVASREGSGVIGTRATRYIYDAAGRITEEQVGWAATGNPETITTTRTFDDAGRLTAETPPANYGAVTHGYDVTNRTHTVTRSGGSTRVTANNLDGSSASTTGTAVVPSYHTYGVETDGRRWHQVNSGASNSARWQKSWIDWFGRGIRSEHPGFTGQSNVVEESIFDTTNGHLTKTTKTGFAPTLFEYNVLGQVTRSGLDYDSGGYLASASNDRITGSDTYLESYNSAWWLRTDTYAYPTPGADTVLVISASRTRLTGHPSNRLSEIEAIDAEGNLTRQYVDVNRSAKTSIATTTRTGISGNMTESTLNGFSTSVTSFDGLTVSKAYDALLRPNIFTDSRGNKTKTDYVSGTKIVSDLVQPYISSGNSSNITAITYSYDGLGRVTVQQDAKPSYTRFAYTDRDQLYRQWGDGAMPVEYGYDSTYGDRITMKTFRGGSSWDGTSWPSSPGTADTTTWTFDGPSGLLTSKTDAANRSATQNYNERGQTASRTLARSVTTTYGYDSSTGELTSQTYSDSTPAVSYTYGRTGQVETVSDYTGTRDLIYDPNKPWRLAAEAESSFYGSRVLTRKYDNTGVIGRVNGFQLGAVAGSNSDLEQTFGFTTVGRFETIASNRNGGAGSAGRTFRYGYLTNSALLQSVAIDGSHPFTVTRTYEDHRDLIATLESKWGSGSNNVRTGYAYTLDERGQRAKSVQSGDVFSDYGDVTSHQFVYNGRGELTADIGYLTNQLEKRENDVVICVGQEEIIDQFRVLAVFGLRAVFSKERGWVQQLCRPVAEWPDAPAGLLPRYFEPRMHGSIEEGKAFGHFVAKVLGLERQAYRSVITALHSTGRWTSWASTSTWRIRCSFMPSNRLPSGICPTSPRGTTTRKRRGANWMGCWRECRKPPQTGSGRRWSARRT